MQKTLIKKATYLLGAAALAVVSFGQSAQAATVQVNCDGGESLQVAVNAASAGDTIEISGTCSENIAIGTNELRLVGSSGAKILGSKGLAVNSRARGTQLIGLIIESDFAAVVASGGSIRIEDSELTATLGAALVISNASYGVVLRSSIKGKRVGLLCRASSAIDVHFSTLDGSGGDGMAIISCQADVTDNQITNNAGNGITVQGSGRVEFVEAIYGKKPNTISNKGRGADWNGNPS